MVSLINNDSEYFALHTFYEARKNFIEYRDMCEHLEKALFDYSRTGGV